MKRVFVPLLAFLCLCFNAVAQTNACRVYFFTVEFISAKPSATVPGKYDVTVNLSWELDANSGNKYTYFHLWEAGSYVPYNFSNPAKPPKAADLSQSLGTIIVANPSSDAASLSHTYNPDAAYTNVLPSVASGIALKKRRLANQTERFTLENFVIPGVTYNASNIYRFIGDLWSSQQNNGNVIHCSTLLNTFAVNDVVNRSSLLCGSPDKVNVRIQSADAAISGTYQVFVDSNTPGVFDEASDVALGSVQAFTTSATQNVGGAWPYNFIAPALEIPSQYSGKPLWVVLNPAGKTREVSALFNSCATLPVTFASFSANRNGHAVSVKWQTATEQNAARFLVQRLASGNWITIASVPAQNNASGSRYEATDANPSKGLSQYRIVEVDVDGKQSMSEIRSVRGETAGSKLTVYPNPSSTGRINLVFDNNSVRDISVIDLNGRVVKQLRGESSSNVLLDLPQDGFYQVQITDRNTGEFMNEKLVVKKR